MMTPEELYHFDLKGYLLVKRAFPTDLVRALHDQLCELEGLGKDQLPPHCVPNWTPVVNEYRIMNVIECGDLFVRLIDHPQVMQWVDALVPPPVRLTEAYSISRRRGVGIPLHAVPIAEYTVTRSGPRCKHLTAVVNLTDCGPEDGPLVVFEGTHKLGVPFPYSLLHPNWPAATHDVAIAEQYLKAVPEGAISIPWEQIPGYKEVCVEAGDLILFTEDLWHGAKELRSDRTRRTLYFAYSPFHFTNWHGIEYSADLKRRVTERQRQLLSGPFIGYRYESADPSDMPASLPFQYMPNSEHTSWRRSGPDKPPAEPSRHGHIAKGIREIFEHTLEERAAAHPELAAQHQGTCQFKISGEGGGQWVLDLSAGTGRVQQGERANADCVVELSAEDFIELFSGRANPVELFYQGKLVTRGNISLAMQLATLWGE